jgi:hypothetical protein
MWFIRNLSDVRLTVVAIAAQGVRGACRLRLSAYMWLASLRVLQLLCFLDCLRPAAIW